MSKIPMVHSGWNQSQPDIDKILDDVFEMGVNHGKGLWNDYPALKQGIKKSIYTLLAAEAEELNNGELDKAHWQGLAVRLSKLKAIMEMKE